MNKKRLAIICGVIFVLFLAIGSIIFWGKNGYNSEQAVIVKDEVNVITDETAVEYQPIEVNEDSIVFQSNPHYEIGDIIVAGIIDEAPNGFIRKVIEVKEENGQYIYETEYAVLTDVFEEAHIIKTFAVTNEAVTDIDEIDNGVMSLNLSSAADDAVVNSLLYSEKDDLRIQETSAVKIKPSENGLGVAVELNDEIGESLQVKGQVEVITYFELKIDIVSFGKLNGASSITLF